MRPTAITPTPPARSSGMLDARLDLPHTSGLTLTDEWLDLSVGLGWSQAAGLWCFPIETVSQSEGGIRRRLPVLGGHPPLARHRRRTRPVGGPDPLSLDRVPARSTVSRRRADQSPSSPRAKCLNKAPPDFVLQACLTHLVPLKRKPASTSATVPATRSGGRGRSRILHESSPVNDTRRARSRE